MSGTKQTPALDLQIGGDHYKSMAIQPVEFIIANDLGFCEGNAIKYICRYKSKGGIEDLKKAKHYIDMLIEQEGKNNDVCIQRKDEEDRNQLDRWVHDGARIWNRLDASEPRYSPDNFLR
jgi:hypothetical protein